MLKVIYGDGYLLNDNSNHGVVSLAVKDEDFAAILKEYLESCSGLNAAFKRKKRLYRVELYSVKAYNFLKKFKLKSLTTTSKKIQCAFLKGFYDSESGIWIENYGNRKPKIKIPWYNMRQTLITFVKNLLTQLGIRYCLRVKSNNRKFKNVKSMYEITINRKDSRKTRFSIARNVLISALHPSFHK